MTSASIRFRAIAIIRIALVFAIGKTSVAVRIYEVIRKADTNFGLNAYSFPTTIRTNWLTNMFRLCQYGVSWKALACVWSFT